MNQDLNDKQLSNLVMVLDRQQINKEKQNRNIDLNKINYLQYINRKNDIQINSAQYNSFLESIDFRPSALSLNEQKKESTDLNKINQIYSMQKKNNQQKSEQLQIKKLKNKDYQQKHRQYLKQDFRLKSLSDVQASRAFAQNNERQITHTHRLKEQKGNQETSLQNHYVSQNTTQTSTTINKSSSKKKNIPKINFNSTQNFSYNTNFNQNNTNQQEKYIKEGQSTPKNKTNSYFFRKEETDEELYKSKTLREESDYQIYNSINGTQDSKFSINTSKSYQNFINSPKNANLPYYDSSNQVQPKYKQLKTLINSFSSSNNLQTSVKKYPSSNLNTAKNIMNSMNTQSNFNTKIKQLQLQNLQNGHQQQFFTERAARNDNNLDTQIYSKNTHVLQDEAKKSKFLQNNSNLSTKQTVSAKSQAQREDQREQSYIINSQNNDDLFSPKNDSQTPKKLDIRIRQTNQQKKQKQKFLQKTSKNQIFFQTEESKLNEQIYSQQEELDLLQTNEGDIKNKEFSIQLNGVLNQTNNNISQKQSNTTLKDEINKDKIEDNDDENNNSYSSNNVPNSPTKQRFSKKSSLIDPSQLMMLKKLIEKKQSQTFETKIPIQAVNQFQDEKQNLGTLELVKESSNTPKQNENQSEGYQSSPNCKSETKKRKSCINVDQDFNNKYLESESNENLIQLGLDYHGIKGLSHYCNFQNEITKKQNTNFQHHHYNPSFIFVNSQRRLELNHSDYSHQQLTFEHSMRGESQRKKINILDMNESQDFEDLSVKNSLILKKNKNTLDRKMQQYIKRTFLEFNKQDNKPKQKMSEEAQSKQNIQINDKKNLPSSQKEIQNQNNLQKLNNQSISPIRTSKIQHQNSIIQLTVSINPPLNNPDNSTKANNNLQIFKFVTFKKDNKSQGSIHSENSQQSNISSDTNEEVENLYFNEENNQNEGDESEKEDDVSLHLQDGNYDQQVNQNYPNFSKNMDQTNQQNNSKLAKMKDPKNSFTVTRNYLMNYLQKQKQSKYLKKMQKINQNIQNIQDNQKIKQEIKLDDQNSFELMQFYEFTPKKQNNQSSSKSYMKLSLDKNLTIRDCFEHTYVADSYRNNPFFSDEDIQNPTVINKKRNKNRIKSDQTKQTNAKRSLQNFSIEEISSSSNSQSDNSQSRSSNSSNSSIDEESLGNTQSQLGMDQYYAQQDESSFQQQQFINDIEIYEDESYDPMSLSNKFLKTVRPLNLSESKSMLTRLYENLPPYISELEESQVEQVLNLKNQYLDKEIQELLIKNNNIRDKFKQISDKLESDNKRNFKLYFHNYYTEEKDLLFGNFEDQYSMNTNFYYSFSQIKNPFKSQTQTSNKSIELNFQKMQLQAAAASTINSKKLIKQQQLQQQQLKQIQDLPSSNDNKEQKEENVYQLNQFNSIKNLKFDTEIQSEVPQFIKKSLEKRIQLSQSLKESVSTSNENFLQIQRSRFSNISQKSQKELIPDDQIKKKSMNSVQQTPIKPKQSQQNLQEQNQDFILALQTLPLTSMQSANNNSQLLNPAKNSNKSKNQQNQAKFENKNYIVLNSNSSQARLQKPDILDRQSLSISNKNNQITKRKLLPPEQQIMMAIKHNQFTEFEDIFTKFHQIQINYLDEEGNNFLIIASSVGNLDIVRQLIYKGININHQNDLGNTALHMALAYGNSEVADFLLQFKIDQNLVNRNNQTAWDTAIMK